jgi:hypothetical protein
LNSSLYEMFCILTGLFSQHTQVLHRTSSFFLKTQVICMNVIMALLLMQCMEICMEICVLLSWAVTVRAGCPCEDGPR